MMCDSRLLPLTGAPLWSKKILSLKIPKVWRIIPNREALHATDVTTYVNHAKKLKSNFDSTMFVTRYVPNQYDYLTFPPMSTNLNMTIEIKRRHFIVIILIIIVPVSLSSEASIQALARTSFSSGNHLFPCGIFSAVGVK